MRVSRQIIRHITAIFMFFLLIFIFIMAFIKKHYFFDTQTFLIALALSAISTIGYFVLIWVVRRLE